MEELGRRCEEVGPVPVAARDAGETAGLAGGLGGRGVVSATVEAAEGPANAVRGSLSGIVFLAAAR